MQQCVKRARPAATRAIQPGQPVKLANRIKSVRLRIEEKHDRQRAKNCETQNHANEKYQRRRG